MSLPDEPVEWHYCEYYFDWEAEIGTYCAKVAKYGGEERWWWEVHLMEWTHKDELYASLFSGKCYSLEEAKKTAETKAREMQALAGK
jgi:hypothetical protein